MVVVKTSPIPKGVAMRGGFAARCFCDARSDEPAAEQNMNNPTALAALASAVSQTVRRQKIG